MGILLGVKSEAAVAVFSTIRTERGRRDAIDAASEYSCDDRQLELLEAVLLVAQSAGKERDALAHGCLGFSEQIEDGILWIESRHIGPWNVSMLLNPPKGGEHAEIAKKIFVYRKEDLEAIYREIHDAWEALFKFHALIRTEDSEAVEIRYRELCSLPRVSSALRGVRERKKNGEQA